MHKFYILVIALFFSFQSSYASHASGADLTYDYLGNGQYKFTLKFYRDCFGIAAPSSPVISISSSCGASQTLTLTQVGSPIEVTPLCPTATSTCNGGITQGLQQYIYTGTITLGQCTDWLFSFAESSRNGAITNSNGASGFDLYVEATLNNVLAPTNSSPDFSNPPVPYICNGTPFLYNDGVVDVNGNVLKYQLINPRGDHLNNVPYQTGFSPTYPISSSTGFNFDSTNGQISLTPNSTQVGIVTVKVTEYNAAGLVIGTVIRDMQLIVINCNNNPPVVLAPINTTGGTFNSATQIFSVCNGSNISFQIKGTDPDTIAPNSDTISITSTNLGLLPGGNATLVNVGKNPKTATFSWTPPAGTIGTYNVSFTIKDNHCPVNSVQTISFRIDIIGINITTPNVHYCQTLTPQTVTLNTSVNPPGGTYLWTPATGLSSTTIGNPTANLTTDVTYVVTYTAAGCITHDTFTASPTTAIVSPTPAVATICAGTTVPISSVFTLNGVPQGTSCNYILKMFDSFGDGWNGAASLAIKRNGVLVGNYKVSTGYYATQNLSFSDGDSVKLIYTAGTYDGEVSFSLVNAAGVSVDSTGPNPPIGTVYTFVSSCASFSWSPATNLSATNISNPIATPTASTTYTVIAGGGGCADTATVAINVSTGTFNLTPLNPTICPGQNVQLNTNFFATPLTCSAGGTCTTPTVITVGSATTNTGTSSTSGAVGSPYQGYYGDGRVQYLFLASELTAAGLTVGTISKLALNVSTKFSSQPYSGFNIKLGCTNSTSLAGYLTGLSTVYSGSVTATTGWNTYTFSSIYTWDGVSNLVVEICYDNSSFSGYDHVYYTSTAFNSVVYDREDGATGCSMTNFTTSTQRPNIRFSNCKNLTYTWSPTASLSASNITNPIATPLVTTPYTVTIVSGACTLVGNTTITVAPANAGIDQTICQFTSATMAATGTGTWSAMSTNPAFPTITNSTSPTTTIGNFVTAGTYNFIWANINCSDTMKVTVTPKPNAGTDQTVCQYTSATMNAVGTGTWTGFSSNPSTPTITTPTSPTTSIGNFATTGVYNLVWTNNFCSDTVQITVTAKPDAGIDQTICQFTSATMAATGTGTWSAMSTNPAFPTIANSTSPTTTIGNFVTAGTYNFIWTNTNCADTMKVTVTPKPNAGTDQTICQYTSATMNAVGTGTWTGLSTNPSTPTITTPTSPTTSIGNFATSGVYNFVWTNNGCSDTVQVTVTAKPDAGIDQTICQFTSATMAATGSGTWTAMSTNPAFPTIANSTSSTTTIGNFATAGTYNFIWTNTNCSDTMKVTVTPKPNAGTDQTVCQYTSATMNATGTGTWTGLSTNPSTPTITTSTSPTTSIGNFATSGVYNFVWTNNGCGDTVKVTVTAKPDAGTDKLICQNKNATMSAVGVGVWSALSTNPAFPAITSSTNPTTNIGSFVTIGVYNFVWTSNSCTDTVKVTVDNVIINNVSKTICQGQTFTLPKGSVVSTANTYRDTLSSANGCDSVVITNLTVNPTPVLNADSTSVCLGQNGTLTATPDLSGGTYSWNTGLSLTNTLTQSPASSTYYTVIYTLNGCKDTAVGKITIKPVPTITAPNTSTCLGHSGTLVATPDLAGGTYSWNTSETINTITKTPAITTVYTVIYTLNGCKDTATPSIIIKQHSSFTQNPIICQGQTYTLPKGSVVSTANTYRDTLVSANGCDSVVITNLTVNPTPVLNADSTSVCLGQNGTLTATPDLTGGTFSWNAGLSLTNTLTQSPAASTYYTVIYTLNGCKDTAVGKITIKPVPNLTAPNTSTCLGHSGTLVATPDLAGGTYSWNTSETINTITKTPAITTVYTVIYTLNGCKDTATPSIIIKQHSSFTQNPIICQGQTYTLPKGSVVSTANTYRDTLVSANGCDSVVITNLTVNPTPVLNADSTSVCLGQNGTLTATPDLTGGTFSWNAGLSLTNTLTQSPAASTYYTVIYTLNGCKDTAVGKITIKPVPNLTAPNTSTCLGHSGTLVATPDLAGGTYSWNTSETINTITKTPAITTVYTVIYTLNGCKDTATPSIIIKQHSSFTQNPIICQGQTYTLPKGSVVSTANTYRDTLVSANGCDSVVITNLTVNPTPVLNADSTSVCLGQNGTLTATPDLTGGTFSWNAGLSLTNTLTQSPATSTYYTVIYTLNGCKDTAVGKITIKPVPTITAPNTSTCLGHSGTLVATPDLAGGTYSWNTSETINTITKTPAITTVYTVIYTLNGCKDTATPSIIIKQHSSFTQNPIICQGQTYTLPKGSVVSTANTYRDTLVSANGCDSVVITNLTVNPTPVLNADSTSVCLGQNGTLTATPDLTGGTFSWNAGLSLTNTLTQSPATSTYYTVIYTLNGCKDTAVGKITIKPVPNLTAPNTSTCLGHSGTLVATPDLAGGTYSWNTSETINTITKTPAITTVYTVIYTLNGCKDTAKPSIIIKQHSSLTQNPIICQGQTYTLPKGSVVSTANTYRDTLVSANGCDSVVITNLTVNPTPVLNADSTSVCLGQNGTLTATPDLTGGTFSWNAGLSNTNTLTQSPATSTYYTVIYTLNGCKDTAVGKITIKPVPTITALNTSTCLGHSGTLVATPDLAGGTYSWNTTETINTITKTPATTTVYTVIYTLNGCKDTAKPSIIIKQHSSLTQNPIICQGQTYTLPKGSVVSTANTYRDTLVSANGCDSVVITNLTVNPTPVLNADSTSVCLGQNGTLTATPDLTGGTYSWNAGLSLTNTLTQSPAASTYYTVIYTLNGCKDTAVGKITIKPVPTITALNTSTCLGHSGTLVATPDLAGGTYSWNTTETINTITKTPATTTVYTVIYTLNGCKDTATPSILIKQHSSFTQNPIICQGQTYTLPKGSVVSTANTYRDTLVSANGCDSVVITNLTVNPTPVLNADSTSVCLGQNGTLTATPDLTGGTYSWNAGLSLTNTLTQSPAASTYYTVIYTLNGCKDTAVGKITIKPVPTITAKDTDICPLGSANISTIVSIPGGTYTWTPTGLTTSSILVSPTVNSNYIVIYTLNGCSATDTATVVIDTVPSIMITTNNAICTAINGTATAHVNGTHPTYTYSWSNLKTTDSIFGLPSASYTVTVTDSKHCTASATAFVGHTNTTLMVGLNALKNVRCFGLNDGAINVSPTNGTPNFTYSWTNTLQTGGSITGLAPATYTVTATDANGCTGTNNFTITQPTALKIDSIRGVNELCFGGNNGSVTVYPSGGSGSYQYVWTNTSQTSQTISAITANTYSVVVKDDSACTANSSILISEPTQLVASISNVINEKCFGDAIGAATVNYTGGVSNYTLLWSNNLTTPTISNLVAGDYFVTVTDKNGCTDSASVTITQPAALSLLMSSTAVKCNGGNDGTASVLASNGTTPYTYHWSDAALQNTSTAVGLKVGTYIVTVTDANLCSLTSSVQVNQPDLLQLSYTATRPSCPGKNDGKVLVTATGGVPGFNFILQQNGIVKATNQTGIFYTSKGIDSVYVTDQNACPASTLVIVPGAPFNTFNYKTDTTSCPGDNYKDGAVHLQGLTIPNAPYQFSVDGSAKNYSGDFYNLAAGFHTVVATDNYGCDTTFTFAVQEPAPAVVEITPADSTIELGETIQLFSTFSPYSASSITNISWYPAEGLNCTDCMNPIFSAYNTEKNLTLTITYNKGCKASAKVNVFVKGEPHIYIPNAFSPNGDGENDVFMAYGKNMKTVSMVIFNRWGEKVYDSLDSIFGNWDGFFKDELQSPGVYVYSIDVTLLNNKKVHKSGSITLIR